MVDYIRDAHELALKVRRFMFAEATDAELAEKLQAIAGVEADLLSTAPEVLYAYRDRLDEAALRLMGELFVHANEQGWTSVAGGPKGTDNRAELIVRDVRRDLGELKGSVDPEAAPAPLMNLRPGGADWRVPAEPSGG